MGRVTLALLLAAMMSVISYHLFTRNNDFPLTYHPDEWSKVGQIGSYRQFRNMNHPLLMIETANLLREQWKPSSRDQREIAIIGRSASALLASIGVFGFAMAGFVRYRFVGLAIVGSAAALCPSLLVYAHYMKEDASLIGGIGVATLGLALVCSSKRRLPQLLASIVLAAGVAMTASAKYVGAAIILPALLALLIAHVPRWWTLPARLAIFLLVALVAFVAINARAFEDPWTLELLPQSQDAFEEEFQHGTTEHSGIRLPTPNWYCVGVAVGHWQTHLLVFAGVAIGAALWRLYRKRRVVSRWGWVAGSTLVAFAVVLAFNAIPFERYALPIVVLGYVLAACAVSATIRLVPGGSHRLLLTSLALMAILFLQGQRCLQFNRQFADDSRERLSQWIAKNLPPGTRVVADSFSALDRVGDVWRFPDRPRGRAFITSRFHASNSGTLQRLAASGVKYVVTAEPNYQRFFAPGVVASEGYGSELEHHRQFYRTLFERGTLVWSSKPSPPSGAYVDPELRVYDISVFKSDPKENATVGEWLRDMWNR